MGSNPPENRKNRPPLDEEAKARIARIKEEREFADSIAQALGETADKPASQIRNIVRYCGTEFVQQLYEDTMEIEANGGLLVMTGERRRTPGGVFFQLARERVDQETRELIFVHWVHTHKKFIEKESVYPPFNYDSRAEILAPLLENPGEVEEVIITLIGRHKELERRQALVIVAMRAVVADGFTMPAGVPIPPKETDFIVYISIRQWEKLIETLEKDENDVLHVSGFCAYDEEMKALAVYATSATTRKLYKQEQGQQKQKIIAEAQAQVRGQMQKGQSSSPSAQKGGGKQGKGGKDNDNVPRKPSPKSDRPERERTRPAFFNNDEEKVTPRPAPTPPPPEVEDGVPVSIAETLRKLYSAAATYRQKIEDIKSKPESQQFGLEMTEKLLASTEKQIQSLEKQYKK